MTAVPPALPDRARNKCLKESHEFTCQLLAKADMRVDKIMQMIPSAFEDFREVSRSVKVRNARFVPLGCGRYRVQLAITLLDSSGAEMALHCDADMVPHAPLMLVAHVAGLEGICLRLHLEELEVKLP
jgi:hypothetical protein